MSPHASFPLHDPVGPDGDASVDMDVLAHLLGPLAADADRRGVQRESLDRLAAAGFLGSPLTPAGHQRELAEVIAGIDATTWFCWVQHQTPLRTLETSDNSALRDRLLAGLRAGTVLAGVAFAHVRRPGPPNPLAVRVDGGWVVNGMLDWVTSWDIADVFLLIVEAHEGDARRLVNAYLPAGRSPEGLAGMVADLPLALLAMGGTHTRPVAFHDVFVPDELVAEVIDKEPWLATDAVHSANSNPAAFGVARGAIAELDALAAQRSDERMAALASALATECRVVRHAAYAAVDDPSVGVDERLRLRAASLDLVARATTSVVVARAGAAMRAGHEAERRVREAMFLQVQAQTAASRAASIDLLITASTDAVNGIEA